MQNQKITASMTGLLAFTWLMLTAVPTQATTMLVSGNAMNQAATNLTNAITGLGLQAVFVEPSNFATTNLAGFDAVWLDGFSQYGSGNWSANLMAFMNGGGKVFVQNPGFGSEGFSAYPLGAQLNAIFTYPPGQESISIVDTTSPVGANHPVNQGLNNAGLSNWGASAYGYFSGIGGFTGLSTTGTAGEWITIVSPVGTGYLVYTQQGVSQYLGGPSNPGAGSEAAHFLNNVVTLSSNPVPEPSSISLFLLGLGFISLIAIKKHQTPGWKSSSLRIVTVSPLCTSTNKPCR